jgi:hypothetical protein
MNKGKNKTINDQIKTVNINRKADLRLHCLLSFIIFGNLGVEILKIFNFLIKNLNIK